MLLKVGELAKRTGLTVRTLHHYDDIGLLRPSARSDAGYRLYNREDISRLHRIQALRRLGLSLIDIGNMLASGGSSLPTVIQQQIAALDQQLAQAAMLRERLTRLLTDLAGNHEPDLADWLNTLELMTMYDKYLTPEESRKLQERKAQTDNAKEAGLIIAGLQDLMARDVSPLDEAAQSLALRWITMVSHLVDGDARMLIKLDAMHRNEPGLQESSGIDDALIAYVSRAAAEANLRIYAKYLTAEEMKKLRARYGQGIATWPPLIAEVRAAMDSGQDPRSPEVRMLAKRWDKLHRTSFTGDDTALREKLRDIYIKEPSLLTWAGIDQEMLAFMGKAMENAS